MKPQKGLLAILISCFVLSICSISVFTSVIYYSESFDTDLTVNTFTYSRFNNILGIFYDYGTWFPGDDVRASTKTYYVTYPQYEAGEAKVTIFRNNGYLSDYSSIINNNTVSTSIIKFSGYDYADSVDYYGSRYRYNGTQYQYTTTVNNAN